MLKMNLFICIMFSVIILGDSQRVEIPLVRFKSVRERMLETGTTEDQLGLVKPKPPKPPSGNDSIALYKFLDADIYGIVGIGHPAQQFKVAFDTAWANTYVPSKLCGLTVPACWLLNKYDSTRSGTYKRNGTLFQVPSKSGNITGFLSTDSFNVGHLKVKGQTFAEITSLPLKNIMSVVDGIVGLGLEALAIDDVVPLFSNIMQQKLLQKPLFSIYLSRDTTTDHAGVILLGDTDNKHFNGTIEYVPVISQYYWQFMMNSVVLNTSQETFKFCVGGCKAVIDTSTRVIVGPTNDIIKLNDLIGATQLISNRYEIPCELVNKMPSVNFTIGTQTFTLHGRDIVQEMSVRGFKVCLSIFVPSYLPSPEDSYWFLGSAFMQRAYVVFDLGKKALGFAKTK